jgi:hypothetical protein
MSACSGPKPTGNMSRQLLNLAFTAVLIVGTAGAGAQSPTPVAGVWESVSVPGGFAALQQTIQTGGVADDWRVIPLAIELSYTGMDGLRTTRNVAAYAAVLRRLHQQATAVSPDRILSLSAGGQKRAVDDLVETLGLEFDRDRRTVKPRTDREAIERTRLFERAGLPMSDIADRLNGGAAVSLSTRDGIAPLPLGAAFWQERFDPTPPPQDLLWAILSSREMSSLYYALLGFDEATLAVAASDTNLAAALVRHALVVPIVVPALRMHEGRVVPPGGPEAAAMWADLVGKRVDRPADFVNSLLAADGGRLAYFYRTLSVLPHVPITADREHLRRLYSAFAAALREWRPDAMSQPPYPGPADVLMDLVVNTDGTLAGAPWRDFWRRVFESDAWPSDPARDIAQLDPHRLLDAADLLMLLCPDGCDTRRMATFALVQREFPQATADLAPTLFAAARARLRYPSLALEIARMKLADPSLYTRLGASAARIEGLPQPQQAVALVQLQSAIALLARLRSVGAPVALIRDKAIALASLQVTPDGFDGGLARWIGQSFQAAADESVDDVAIRSLAGAPWLPPGPALEWEGIKYRVDIAATEESRIHAIREKFSANVLSAATTLVRIADTLPDAVAGGSVEASLAALTETLNAADAVDDVSWTGGSATLESFRGVPREVASTLRKARPSDRGRIERATGIVRAAADVIAADALAALVYALTIQDPDNPFTMTRELPRRHHLQPEGAGGNRVSPWELPVERVPDRARRYISGSFLGLAAGVPQLAVRRLAAARPIDEPNMSILVATELQRSAALAAPWTVAEEDLAAIHAARVKGAANLEATHDASSLDAFISKGGISGPRAGWLRWSIGRGQAVAEMMTLEDLVRAGGLDQRSSSWGVSAPRATCLCLTLPAFTWEMQGMPRQPEAAAVTIVEPALRIAIEIRERRLPAALAPGVLALVMTDVIERSTLPHHSDVPTIGRSVRRMAPSRFDDYIAAVAARGPLVPVADEPRADR